MKTKLFKSLAISIALCVCILTFISAGCSNSVSTEYDVVKQTKKDNYTYLNEMAEREQLVLIGDSIIEIYNTELFADYPLRVYNRGISGDTSDRLLERLQCNALNIQPQKLVILIGTNDLARNISVDAIVGNIEKIIENSKASGVVDLYICSLLPVNKTINASMVGRRKNSDIQAINAKLQQLCNKNQTTYVDVNTPMQDSDGNFDSKYTYDGLHPNAMGYKIFTDELLKRI